MKSSNSRRMAGSATLFLLTVQCVVLPGSGSGQTFDPPDRAEPGDAMIQAYLRQEAEKIEGNFPGPIKTPQDWMQARPRFRQEYFDMLGLWPLPEKGPLLAAVTRTLDRGDYMIEMVHYQSRPGLYVTGNLYRPAKGPAGERLPAILVVCGHSGMGRNGNKTAFQSLGAWFGRHGYVCLVLDTIELGEMTCTHHGTYWDGRWWWLSRGFTPAGVECWNGVRGIDYLLSRPEVDPERIGVTGISGGGAATLWVSAADERVKAAVPVSGMSDLLAYVPGRLVNGHCDCMFLYNTYQWPWVRIPGLVAPRPLLFVNSDNDFLFPMYGNERIINRLERIYTLYGAGDYVDSLVSIGGHGYRQDIRQATFRFMNTYLKNNPRPVLDSEVELALDLPAEQLRVFPRDSDLPADAMNARIDREFVPMAKPELPKPEQFEAWKTDRLARLRQLSFHHFPDRIPPARAVETNATGIVGLETESPIRIRLRAVRLPSARPERAWIVATGSSADDAPPAWLNGLAGERDAVYVCEPRGIGSTRWTLIKRPPDLAALARANYVARAHPLLGRTVDSGRVWDLVAAARYVRAQHDQQTPVFLAGEGAAAVLSIYAALLEPDIGGVALSRLPATHMGDATPQLLGVLRVCDVPQALGLLAPRPATLVGPAPGCQDAAALYRAAGVPEKFMVKK